MRTLYINNFQGVKRDVDPRVLEPNRDDTGKAEAVVCNNMESNKEGALITSTGYELVTTVPEGTGGIKTLINYDKTPSDRFLVVVRNDKMYYMDPTSSDLTELGDYGEESEYVSGLVYKGNGSERKLILLSSNENNSPKAITIGDATNLHVGQIETDKYQYEYLTNPDSRYAFSFRFDNEYKIKTLKIRVRDQGSPDDLECSIYECDELGKPTGAAIVTETGSITGASTTYGTMSFSFNWDCPDYSKEYAFVIKPPAAAGGPNYWLLLKSLTSDLYKRGVSSYSTDGGTVYGAYTDSLFFEFTRDSEGAIETIGEDALKGGYIGAEFLGHLFIANGKTLFYSGTEDETSWGSAETGDAGAIGLNDYNKGMLVEGDKLISFMRESNQGIHFTFDDNNNLVVPKKDYDRKYGCLAPKSVQAIGSNAVYWSEMGVVSLGVEERFDSMGLPRPLSVSEDIDPLLELINKDKADAVIGKYYDKDRKYWLGIPTGTSAVNDGVFVYDLKRKTWHTRSGFYPAAFESFRNSKYESELYFGSANSGEIFKFNDSYNYNGDGYKRVWKSKIFTFGSNTRLKRIHNIRFTGAMSYNTVIYITFNMDGELKKYEIDSSFILGKSYSDYIGDNIIGDSWKGGVAPEDSEFKRFFAPVNIAKSINTGFEFQITIENEGADQPFKIDGIEIQYEILDNKEVPGLRYINKQITV